MLTKFLIAIVCFVLAFVVLATAGVDYAGLIALAIGIVAFLVAPRRVDRL